MSGSGINLGAVGEILTGRRDGHVSMRDARQVGKNIGDTLSLPHIIAGQQHRNAGDDYRNQTYEYDTHGRAIQSRRRLSDIEEGYDPRDSRAPNGHREIYSDSFGVRRNLGDRDRDMGQGQGYTPGRETGPEFQNNGQGQSNPNVNANGSPRAMNDARPDAAPVNQLPTQLASQNVTPPVVAAQAAAAPAEVVNTVQATAVTQTPAAAKPAAEANSVSQRELNQEAQMYLERMGMSTGGKNHKIGENAAADQNIAGRLDGIVGPKTSAALQSLNIDPEKPITAETVAALKAEVQKRTEAKVNTPAKVGLTLSADVLETAKREASPKPITLAEPVAVAAASATPAVATEKPAPVIAAVAKPVATASIAQEFGNFGFGAAAVTAAPVASNQAVKSAAAETSYTVGELASPKTPPKAAPSPNASAGRGA
jgi:hypothetical protein